LKIPPKETHMKVPGFRSLGFIVSLLVLAPATARADLILVSPGLVYDTVQNLTWAQDVALGGSLTFAEANVFVDNLVYGGFDDWRLPQHNQVNCLPNCPPWDSEVSRALAQIGWVRVGADYRRGSAGPLVNFDPSAFLTLFWLGPGFQGTTTAGEFRWTSQDDTDLVDPGSQTGGHAFVWVVRDGPPQGVPEPSTLALIGLGVLGLARSRKKRHSNVVP
jgi:hypothetical protein